VVVRDGDAHVVDGDAALAGDRLLDRPLEAVDADEVELDEGGGDRVAVRRGGGR
jgi:hypothetical protein